MALLVLLLIVAALLLGGVGAWFGNARLVGIGLVCLALAALLPRVD